MFTYKFSIYNYLWDFFLIALNYHLNEKIKLYMYQIKN